MKVPATHEIDRISEVLIEEYNEHKNEVIASLGDEYVGDEWKIYSGWSIQKIAALQVMVLELWKEKTSQ